LWLVEDATRRNPGKCGGDVDTIATLEVRLIQLTRKFSEYQILCRRANPNTTSGGELEFWLFQSRSPVLVPSPGELEYTNTCCSVRHDRGIYAH